MNRQFVLTSVVSAVVVAAVGAFVLKTVDCGRKPYDPDEGKHPFERRMPVEREPEPELPPEPENVGIPFDDPVSDKTITLSQVETVAVKPLEVIEKPQWTKGTFGEPRELLRAKHLRLSDDTPMTANRGIVEITDGRGFDAETLEAVLVDFETGEVARFADAFGSMPGIGLAFGRTKTEGGPEESVIIHPDGLAVPYVPEGSWYRLLDVVVNAGHREIYLFDVNEDRDKNGPGTKFSHWTDLRSPPPPTSLPFPFQPRDDDETTKRYGEYDHDRDGVARNISASIRNSWGDGCTRAEVLRDGSTRCIRPSDEILGEGWHLTKLDEGWVAYNEDRKEIQRLAFSEGCGLSASVAAPPRARFGCEDFSAVWSPERVSRWPDAELGPGRDLTSGHEGRLMVWGKRWDGNQSLKCKVGAVADAVSAMAWTSEPLDASTIRVSSRYTVVHRCGEVAAMVLDAERGTLETLADDQRCQTIHYWTHHDAVFAFDCENASQRALWSGFVDLESRTRWTTKRITAGSGNNFRYVWIVDSPLRVVWVDEDGASDRLLVSELRRAG